jgi:hypothetical protein
MAYRAFPGDVPAGLRWAFPVTMLLRAVATCLCCLYFIASSTDIIVLRIQKIHVHTGFLTRKARTPPKWGSRVAAPKSFVAQEISLPPTLISTYR